MSFNFKKLGLALIVLAGLTTSNSNAQTFTWGAQTSSMKETGGKLDHFVDKKLYQVNSIYNENLFNRDVKVSSYSLSTLDKEKTNDLSIEQPAMGKAMMTHLEMFEEKGVNQVIFLDEFNTKTKERELFFQRVNIETGVKTKPALVTSMPTRNSTYFIAQSPNKSYYAVIKQHSHDKKLNEKINVTLLDKDFKVVKEITYETAYMNKTPMENKLFVSDKGVVFIVKDIDLAKAKPFKTLYFWDGSAATMQETSLKFDNDFQIYQYQGHFDGEDFYIHGLYTRIGSKGVQMYGGSLPAAGIYAARFGAKGEKKYIETSDTGEIAGLNMKEFVFENNKTWLFADKLFVAKKAKPMVQGSFNFEYDYTYSNNAIVFGKIDNESGKLEWHKVLAYEEPNTVNDNGSFLSYLHIVKNNQLTLLYNDTQKTKYRNYVVNDRFIEKATFDDRGNQIAKEYLAATGLEIDENGVNFDLDTSTDIEVQDNKHIVRARNGNVEKYGYLNL